MPGTDRRLAGPSKRPEPTNGMASTTIQLSTLPREIISSILVATSSTTLHAPASPSIILHRSPPTPTTQSQLSRFNRALASASRTQREWHPFLFSPLSPPARSFYSSFTRGVRSSHVHPTANAVQYTRRGITGVHVNADVSEQEDAVDHDIFESETEEYLAFNAHPSSITDRPTSPSQRLTGQLTNLLRSRYPSHFLTSAPTPTPKITIPRLSSPLARISNDGEESRFAAEGLLSEVRGLRSADGSGSDGDGVEISPDWVFLFHAVEELKRGRIREFTDWWDLSPLGHVSYDSLGQGGRVVDGKVTYELRNLVREVTSRFLTSVDPESLERVKGFSLSCLRAAVRNVLPDSDGMGTWTGRDVVGEEVGRVMEGNANGSGRRDMAELVGDLVIPHLFRFGSVEGGSGASSLEGWWEDWCDVLLEHGHDQKQKQQRAPENAHESDARYDADTSTLCLIQNQKLLIIRTLCLAGYPIRADGFFDSFRDFRERFMAKSDDGSWVVRPRRSGSGSDLDVGVGVEVGKGKGRRDRVESNAIWTAYKMLLESGITYGFLRCGTGLRAGTPNVSPLGLSSGPTAINADHDPETGNGPENETGREASIRSIRTNFALALLEFPRPSRKWWAECDEIVRRDGLLGFVGGGGDLGKGGIGIGMEEALGLEGALGLQDPFSSQAKWKSRKIDGSRDGSADWLGSGSRLALGLGLEGQSAFLASLLKEVRKERKERCNTSSPVGSVGNNDLSLFLLPSQISASGSSISTSTSTSSSTTLTYNDLPGFPDLPPAKSRSTTDRFKRPVLPSSPSSPSASKVLNELARYSIIRGDMELLDGVLGDILEGGLEVRTALLGELGRLVDGFGEEDGGEELGTLRQFISGSRNPRNRTGTRTPGGEGECNDRHNAHSPWDSNPAKRRDSRAKFLIHSNLRSARSYDPSFSPGSEGERAETEEMLGRLRECLRVFVREYVLVGVPREWVERFLGRDEVGMWVDGRGLVGGDGEGEGLERGRGRVGGEGRVTIDGKLWPSRDVLAMVYNALVLLVSSTSPSSLSQLYEDFKVASYCPTQLSRHGGPVRSHGLPPVMLPTPATYTPFLERFGFVRGLEVLREMVDERGLACNAWNWNVVVGQAAREGEGRFVEMVLGGMGSQARDGTTSGRRQDQVLPPANIITYLNIIRGYTGSDLERAQEMVERMKGWLEGLGGREEVERVERESLVDVRKVGRTVGRLERRNVKVKVAGERDLGS